MSTPSRLTRLEGSAGEAIAGAARQPNAANGSRPVRGTIEEYLFRQVRRRRCPFGDGPIWSEMAVFGVTLVVNARVRMY
jgi:hypothetical protein